MPRRTGRPPRPYFRSIDLLHERAKCPLDKASESAHILPCLADTAPAAVSQDTRRFSSSGVRTVQALLPLNPAVYRQIVPYEVPYDRLERWFL